MKAIHYFLISLFALLLASCSTSTATPTAELIWKVEVSDHDQQASLSAVEAVTQYDGTTVDVEHEQSAADGNTYILLKVSISKVGAASTSFDWQNLVLQDQDGNAYQRYSNDTFLEQYGYTPRITGLEIRLGVNEGWLCFEIPQQAADNSLTLRYTGEGSQQEITIPK